MWRKNTLSRARELWNDVDLNYYASNIWIYAVIGNEDHCFKLVPVWESFIQEWSSEFIYSLQSVYILASKLCLHAGIWYISCTDTKNEYILAYLHCCYMLCRVAESCKFMCIMFKYKDTSILHLPWEIVQWAFFMKYAM